MVRKLVIVFQGSRVHYRSAGPADGKILFLLHGSAFNSQHWEDIRTIQTMAAAGNRVYAVDLPGNFSSFDQLSSSQADSGEVIKSAVA